MEAASPSPVQEGGCLCGDVRWRVTGPILHSDHCHYIDCTQTAGAPYATWSTVAASDFAFISGTPSRYRSDLAERTFCGRCGGKLTFKMHDLDEVDVAGATFDDPSGLNPESHVHFGNVISWCRVDPHIHVRPGYEVNERGRTDPVKDGEVLEGGCRCGAVRFSVEGPPAKSALCHCTTCRGVTGSFTSAWAIWPTAQFRHLKGDTVAYQNSENGARRFCGICGSTVFFEPLKRADIAEIQIPALDTPGRVAPALHQFTRSMPEWLSFGDDLPRYPGSIADGPET